MRPRASSSAHRGFSSSTNVVTARTPAASGSSAARAASAGTAPGAQYGVDGQEQERGVLQIRTQREKTLGRARGRPLNDLDRQTEILAFQELADASAFRIDDARNGGGASGARGLDRALDQRLATDLDERLRRGDAGGAEALAEAGGDDACLHRSNVSRSSSEERRHTGVGSGGVARSRGASHAVCKPALAADVTSRSHESPT